MRFTYCLVTKGRDDYLSSALASLKVTLQHEDVQVIIIDNGCPKSVSGLLSSWCESGGNRAHYIRFDINDTAAPRIWNAIKNYEIEWITFPGDDDVVSPEFLNSARSMIQINCEITALAASMQIIDAAGNRTGQVRNPLKFTGDRVQYLATSIHEPPFLFPALFIKFDSVQMSLPSSRYIFDWWLSLNLILLGEIMTTDEIAVDYRVHENQESSIAPNRRKYFEAQVVLHRFIDSSLFSEFFLSLSDWEKYNFWGFVTLKEPIYGDNEFGNAIKLQLLLKIADSMQDSKIAGELLAGYAAKVGTLLRQAEVRSFLAPALQSSDLLPGNFKLFVATGSCLAVYKLANTVGAQSPTAPTFSVGCHHSKADYAFLLDCELLLGSNDAALDMMLVKITNSLEKNGEFDFKISPFEKTLVGLFRRIKGKMPHGMHNLVRSKIESHRL